jgi:hypothetical protein
MWCRSGLICLLLFVGPFFPALASYYPALTLSSATSTTPIVINPRPSGPIDPNLQLPTNLALGIVCTLSGGASLTYSIQVTADPPNNITNWNNHDTLTGLTASANGNIAFPVTAIRLNVSSYSSGSVNCGVAQWP